MEKVAAPWWISIWPLLNIILVIAVFSIAILLTVRLAKFLRLGILVFTDYLEKNKK